MIFIRRGSPPSRSFVYLRVGSLFAAVALWFVGIRMESDLLRITAMAVIVVALAVGNVGRRAGEGSDIEKEGSSREEVARRP